MKIHRIMALAGLVAIGTAGCADLDVTNLNAPDRERAISTPSDVEALIAGSFNAWWRSQHDWQPGPMLSVMADEHTASWGNFGMQDASEEPRKAINNDPSWGYAYVMEDTWSLAYRSLSAVRDGLAAIEGGVEIGNGGVNNTRAIAFGKFVQGLALGTLGLVFDQAFILDENTDLESASLVPYTDVMAASYAKLGEAIQMASANDFDIPGSWVGNFEGFDNEVMAQVARSFLARYMASEARSEAERDGADWGAIASLVDQGYHGTFGPISDATLWWDILKSYGGTMPIWARTDMRMLGPADVSGKYEEWMALPPADRNEYLIVTPDRRVTGAEPTDKGRWFQYHGPSRFRPERGTYHFSFYGDLRYEDFRNACSPWGCGLTEDITEREMDYLRAEAHFRAGQRQAAADLVNKYRVANGELPPVTVDGAPGGTDSCVPQMPNGSCADLWESLKYDKRIEVWHTGLGIHYFDDRGWGDLVSGTAVHLPVPGSELLTLLMDIYTFGGDAGGAAPAPSLDEIQAGPLTPEQIRARVEAYEAWDDAHRLRAAEHVGVMN